jgi:hypothetical protein
MTRQFVLHTGKTGNALSAPEGVLPVPEFGQTGKKKERQHMSIINKPPERVKREYRLQEPVAVAAQKYLAFSASTPDDVVNSALKMLLWLDADFRRGRRQQPTPSDEKDPHGAAKVARA